MANEQERDVIYFSKRSGTQADPYVDITENLFVQYGKVFLKELPSEPHKVTVQNSNGTYMTEVYTNDNLANQTNSFYVNYREGIVFFSTATDGQSKKFVYKGTGIILYPASRIYSVSSDGSGAIQVLQDIVSLGQNIAPQGAYNATRQYLRGNIVSYNGASYMAVMDTRGNVPPNTSYWQLISERGSQGVQGVQGIQGVQGEKGETGITLYTWVKYADSPTTGMSDTPTGKDYIGFATNKPTSNESTNYADYQWSYIRGEQGIRGIQGIQGEQGIQGQTGITLHTWIKYADTPTTGMSDLPTGKNYIGIAVNKTTATESTVYTDYAWSLIRGEQGVQGVQGQTGATGNVANDWKGEYVAATAYPKGSLVNYSGRVYIAVQATTGNLPTNTTFWNLFVDKGTDGLGAVNSVNGKTGNVTLNASEVGAIDEGERGIAGGIAELNEAGQVVDADGNPVTGDVKTVNGESGNVVLTPEDIGSPSTGDFTGHTGNSDIHVTLTKKVEWDAKETTVGAQAKATQALNDAKTHADTKETPTGAQAKATQALNDAKTYTDGKVAGLVNSAPATLDTLKELSDALGGDSNFAATVAGQIGGKMDKSQRGIAGGVAGLNAQGQVIDAAGNVISGGGNAPAPQNVSVKDYENLVTGGSWTAAIQAAFNAVGAGGTVIFPKGDYTTGTFTVPVSCLVTGSGTLIYNFTGATGAMMRITASNVTVQNLTFREVGTVGSWDYKAYIHSASTNTMVKDCRFFSGMQGVHFANGSAGSKVLNCIAENCFASGILLLGTSHCSVVGNTTTNCGDGALSLFNASYCSAIGNKVNVSDQGITIDAGSVGNTITGNQIYGNQLGTNGKSGYYGIDLKNNSHSNTISGNSISGFVCGISARYGDANDGGTLQAVSSNNVIIGNTITECSNKGYANNPCGIFIQAQYGLTVSNNVISRVAGTGILGLAEGSRNSNITISNNMINLHGVNFGSLQYQAYNYPAVRVDGFTAVTVSGNTVQCPPETMTQYLMSFTNTAFNAFGNTFSSVTYRVFNVAGTSSGQISSNTFATANGTTRFADLSTTGETVIRHNTHVGTDLRYLVFGNTSRYLAEGNVFTSSYADAMAGTGNVRMLNNENKGTGMQGGEMRYASGKLEIKINGVWTQSSGGTVNMTIEERTTDPASPTVGQIWIRTDL